MAARVNSAKGGWQKLLYLDQHKPDNYVDSSFLKELRRNEGVPIYGYWQIVSMMGSFSQHLNSFLIFIILFTYAYFNKMNASQMVILSELTTFTGYLSWMLYVRSKGNVFRYQGKQTAKSGLILIISLLTISPILRTLTEDVSSDSIWTMSFFCIVVNLVLTDYRMHTFWQGKGASAIALNAAIFSAVILASRLPSNIHVFGLVSFAFNWFALLPIFRRSLKAFSSPLYHVLLTLGLFSGSFLLLMNLSIPFAQIHIIGMLVLTFVVPLYYRHLQKFKNQINGPWDEASVTLSASQE